MKTSSRLKRTLLYTAVVLVACLAGLYLSVAAFPQFGARGADSLRKVVGDQAVARVEMIVFRLTDTLNRFFFRFGLLKVASPWQMNAEYTPTVVYATAAPPPPTPAPIPTATQAPLPLATALAVRTQTPIPTPAPSPTAIPWSPPTVRPLGNMQGEGDWQPYLHDRRGSTVAYRTLIQPDPLRPYALVAAVAFDLRKVKLNFVLGYEEPGSTGSTRPPGTITAADNIPGVLLAAFNGGFKSQHGKYGAMADGIMPLEPRKGYATVLIYRSGLVRIGEWGYDFDLTEDVLAFRQNCSLVIDNGRISPLVYMDNPIYWGAKLDGSTATWRSALGISEDLHTLYYFAGPSLKMPALAQAMAAAGVENGMQLDINDYWVHFVGFRNENGKLVPEPLFPDSMKADVGRYLAPHARDFFYIALRQP